MKTDGWVTIGARLDNSKLEDDIKNDKTKLRRFQKEAEELTTIKSEHESNVSNIEKQINEQKRLRQEYDETAQKIEFIKEKQKELADAGTRYVDMPEQYSPSMVNLYSEKMTELFGQMTQMPRVETLEPQLEAEKRALDDINLKIQENAKEQETVKQRIQENIIKTEELKRANESNNEAAKKHDDALKNIGNSISNAVRKVGRWALAVIGVSGAYMAVRRAISIVSAQNERIENSFTQIQKVIAGALLPVVQQVINFIVKIMYYINYIWKFFTGKNLFNFADATKKSAKELREASKNTGKMSKDLKDARKQIAGFDEMNILDDNVKSSDGSGGGSNDPNFGNIFDQFKNVKIPKWLTDFLQWLLDHGETLKLIIEGLATAFVMLKSGLTGFDKAFGIFLVIDGLAALYEDAQKYTKDPSLENLANIIRDIGEVLTGLAFVVGLTTPLGILLAIVGQFAIMVGGIFKTIKNLETWLRKPTWNNFKTLLEGALDNFGVLGIIVRKVFDLFGGFDKVVEPLHKYYDWFTQTFIPKIKTGFESIWDTIRNVFGPVIKFFKNIFETVYKNIKIAFNNIRLVFSASWTAIKTIFNPVITFFQNKFEKVRQKIEDAIRPVVNFFGNLWTSIKEKLKDWGVKAGKAIGGALHGAINAILGRIEDILNKPVNAINGLINKVKKIPGLQKLQTLNTISLPRLAKGGIINMPGRGIPIGGAIGGETGPEGVIPLTDNQQMELLGEAIGKYITINATITNTMNGRVISRELKKVQNESDFAFNR